MITAFLQMLDGFRGSSLLIAATNHGQLLDSALWRRFDEVLSFERPTVHQLRKVLRLRLRATKHQGLDIEGAASELRACPTPLLRRPSGTRVGWLCCHDETLLNSTI